MEFYVLGNSQKYRNIVQKLLKYRHQLRFNFSGPTNYIKRKLVVFVINSKQVQININKDCFY